MGHFAKDGTFDTPFQEWQTNHMLDETEVLKLGRDISAALALHETEDWYTGM